MQPLQISYTRYLIGASGGLKPACRKIGPFASKRK